MNKKIIQAALGISTLLAVLLLPKLSFASAGPVGLNEIRTEAGPGVGEITLMWRRFDANITNYNLNYGDEPGKYKYGAFKIGNIVTFTVKNLTPGSRYCFRLYPFINDQISDPRSPEICDVASTTNGTVIGTPGPHGRNQLTAVAGPSKGQVTLTWKKYFAETTSYNIVYGLQPGVYIYGVNQARDVTYPFDNDFAFTIGQLNPGTRYYFALIPFVSGTAIYTTAEVSQISP